MYINLKFRWFQSFSVNQANQALKDIGSGMVETGAAFRELVENSSLRVV
jgi:hypothetical protein